MTKSTYLPHDIFTTPQSVPRVLIAPARYIQGPGVLGQLGRYLSLIPAERAGILITPGGMKRVGGPLLTALTGEKITPYIEYFRGECSFEEVDRAAASLQKQHRELDCLVAVGGGKCLDAGKGVAYRLGIPVVTCPTIASTDAPCSAVSVMYRPDGVADGGEYYPHSPAVVVVDTAVIVKAPARMLAAGIGDALATWFEAKACFDHPEARTVVGGRPNLTTIAVAEAGYKALLEHGPAAVDAVNQGQITEAVELVVEINTLISGIGFESGGLAAAHAVAGGLTIIPAVRDNYMHGELVGIGILAQLTLTRNQQELDDMMTFFKKIGLPVSLSEMGLEADIDRQYLDAVVDRALQASFIHHVGFEVTAGHLMDSLLSLF